MAQGKLALTAVVAAVTLSASAVTSRAADYAEGPGDAGQMLATAQSTGTPGSTLTSVSGTLIGTSDADLYAFTLSSPGTFSATTVGGSDVDTALFLLDGSGRAIAANDDDASGTSLQSTLAAGDPLYASLAAGVYYLGVSVSHYEPVNSANQALFTADTGGATTTTRGPASGVNPDTESDFSQLADFTGDTGPYSITLTGAMTALNPNAVPEPSTWAVLAASLMVLGFLRRRRAA